MTHPSYAFDGEDTKLWELVGDKEAGFFIDVGANDPLFGCVSKSFYDKGWRGINIEPLPYYAEKWKEAQPRSSFLSAALSDHSGEAVLLSGPVCDHWATLEPRVAQTKGLTERYEVKTMTLAEVCRSFRCPQIDWMKIDVEGWEDKVIRGGDWDRYRPKVLCIESFVPHTSQPSHMNWEGFITDQGYDFVEALAINRFYVRRD